MNTSPFWRWDVERLYPSSSEITMNFWLFWTRICDHTFKNNIKTHKKPIHTTNPAVHLSPTKLTSLSDSTPSTTPGSVQEVFAAPDQMLSSGVVPSTLSAAASGPIQRLRIACASLCSEVTQVLVVEGRRGVGTLSSCLLLVIQTRHLRRYELFLIGLQWLPSQKVGRK